MMTTSPAGSARGDAFAPDSVPERYARLLAPAIFAPWAHVLVESVGLAAGKTVLDVACGTGVVARLAARRVGLTGRVVATDISAAMVATARAHNADPDAAAIEWVHAPATNLGVPDDEFGVVLCQQGLPFFTDRIGALREMRRVVRADGIVGLAVWAAERPLFPFREYTEVLDAHGLAAPFPGAYDGDSYVMSQTDVKDLLAGAGFSAIDVRTTDLDVSWPDRDTAAQGILGTPFGPLVAALADEPRRALLSDLAAHLDPQDDRPLRRVTTSVIARATA
jgi:SAM-dependent methyltransferase